MKFKILVENEDRVWWEEYDVDVERDHMREWIHSVIHRFNATLGPGELARKLVATRVLDSGKTFFKHTWEKSNLVTKSKGGDVYDTYRCKVCGITGKRYGLSSVVTIDTKYKAKVYRRCDTAKAHLEKRRAKAHLEKRR